MQILCFIPLFQLVRKHNIILSLLHQLAGRLDFILYYILSHSFTLYFQVQIVIIYLYKQIWHNVFPLGVWRSITAATRNRCKKYILLYILYSYLYHILLIPYAITRGLSIDHVRSALNRLCKRKKKTNLSHRQS
jgi:hypothetical protein